MIQCFCWEANEKLLQIGDYLRKGSKDEDMPYQDTDPERRNLLVTSLVFIAYYYAEGSVSNGELKLQIIDIVFSNPEALAMIAWAILFWFCYRYWVTHKKKFKEGFEGEISTYSRHPILCYYAFKESGKTFVGYPEKSGHVLCNFDFSEKPLRLYFQEAAELDWSNKKTINTLTPASGENGFVEFKGIKGWLAFTSVGLICCLQNPSFSSYVTPYILFIGAVTSPFFSSLF